MQRNEVQGDQEITTLPKTHWAYVPCRYGPSKVSEANAPTLLSSFCCCFKNDNNNHYSPNNFSVHFNIEDNHDDPPVTLSQALLCLDNPQIPSDLVSYPISEELILSQHRSQNVLEQPSVIRSTQMLFMGYDFRSLQGIDVHQSGMSLDERESSIASIFENDQIY